MFKKKTPPPAPVTLVMPEGYTFIYKVEGLVASRVNFVWDMYYNSEPVGYGRLGIDGYEPLLEENMFYFGWRKAEEHNKNRLLEIAHEFEVGQTIELNESMTMRAPIAASGSNLPLGSL